jgi:hypothetical protein
MVAVTSLDALRARIREIEGAPVVRRRVSLGVTALDAALGGLCVPGLVELYGAPGSGCTRLGLMIAASFQQRGEQVAWVDVPQRLYPPAIAEYGVRPTDLMMFRPPRERAAWAVEQLARSGAFALLVVQSPEPAPKSTHERPSAPPQDRRAGMQWDRAAEAGQCLIVVLSASPSRALPADVRVEVDAGQLVVHRDRYRATTGAHPLPPRAMRADPWA